MDTPTSPDDDQGGTPYAPPASGPNMEAFDADNLIPEEKRQLHTGLGVMVGMALAGATWTILALLSARSVSDWTAYEWGENSVSWIVALWLPGGFVYVPLARKISIPGSIGLRGGLMLGAFLCPFLWLLAASLFA